MNYYTIEAKNIHIYNIYVYKNHQCHNSKFLLKKNCNSIFIEFTMSTRDNYKIQYTSPEMKTPVNYKCVCAFELTGAKFEISPMAGCIIYIIIDRPV